MVEQLSVYFNFQVTRFGTINTIEWALNSSRFGFYL